VNLDAWEEKVLRSFVENKEIPASRKKALGDSEMARESL
jgi:hypothetical protein